ncbi:hypothetical protein GOD90_16830 [Sinorhizobium medicae]|uniref:Uncharacterized protein n=1 Tax=Sinorhizobium medicae (strain WSM419) TaxID=366394 RepID=A6U8T5_SINMW|nr:hypothetical protein Smed_1215 [Sinorhizobium medicae WSM419]MDX0480543.1 hypothetical protein [Sinorhizobium medicae]MDX0838016.1 hypothetical protein [Sinorhizobium medicae]MDX0851358.1 hypothetical protein [Sinorhizobium medicae]MDX0898637.1 hypothetical protein [Sinorhizobium medicae]
MALYCAGSPRLKDGAFEVGLAARLRAARRGTDGLPKRGKSRLAGAPSITQSCCGDEANVLACPAPNHAIMVASREAYGFSIISKEGEPLQATLI